METKALPLEVDSLNHEKGTATIAHAVYNNLDLVDDIAYKGMFTKTWKEKTLAEGMVDISFYVNHDDTQAPGKVTRVHDNERKAFTDVKMGTHTLGRDTLIMLDEGTIRKASFGFHTLKSEKKQLPNKGKIVRGLQEVNHLETSVLTRLSANPLAGIERVTKQLHQVQTLDGPGLLIDLKSLQPEEQTFMKNMLSGSQANLEKLVAFSGTLTPESDLYTTISYWISRLTDSMSDMKSCLKYNMKELPDDGTAEVKAQIAILEKFCRNTKASDGAILEMQAEIKSLQDSLALNTETTPLIPEPASSEVELKSLADGLMILSLNI